jgi:hypothetical protein
MRHCALHLYATRMKDPPRHFWGSLRIVSDHRSRELLKVPFPCISGFVLIAKERGGPAVLANETATPGWSRGPSIPTPRFRTNYQQEPQARASDCARKGAMGQVLQVGTPFGQNKRVDNSSVQQSKHVRLQRRAAAGGPSEFWLGVRSLWSTLLSSTHIGNSALMCQEQVVTIGPVFRRSGGA